MGFLSADLSSTELVKRFEDFTSTLVNNIFPLKTVTVSDKDKVYFTEELRKLRRQRQRIYRKSGRTQKYLEIKSKFDALLRKEVKKYQQKVQNEVLEGTRNSCYSALRKLGVGGKSADKTFTLPNHAEDELSPLQSAEKFAVCCISRV